MSPAWHPGAWQDNRQLGKGAFKDVNKGFDEEKGIEVTWCQAAARRIGESEKAQIRTEVELVMGLTHQNILAFIDFFELSTPSKPIVFITELMSSGTLKQCAAAARVALTVLGFR